MQLQNASAKANATKTTHARINISANAIRLMQKPMQLQIQKNYNIPVHLPHSGNLHQLLRPPLFGPLLCFANRFSTKQNNQHNFPKWPLQIMAKLQSDPTTCDRLSYATTYPNHHIFPGEITTVTLSRQWPRPTFMDDGLVNFLLLLSPCRMVWSLCL